MLEDSGDAKIVNGATDRQRCGVEAQCARRQQLVRPVRFRHRAASPRSCVRVECFHLAQDERKPVCGGLLGIARLLFCSDQQTRRDLGQPRLPDMAGCGIDQRHARPSPASRRACKPNGKFQSARAAADHQNLRRLLRRLPVSRSRPAHSGLHPHHIASCLGHAPVQMSHDPERSPDQEHHNQHPERQRHYVVGVVWT